MFYIIDIYVYVYKVHVFCASYAELLTHVEPQVVNFGFGKASFEAIKRMGYNASFSVYRCVLLGLDLVPP